MRDVLRTAPEAPDPVTAPLVQPASLSKVHDPDTIYNLTKAISPKQRNHVCKWNALKFICIPAGVRLCAGDRSDGADWQSADASSKKAAC